MEALPAEMGVPTGSRAEQANQLIHLYGESVRSFFRDQQRSTMISPLFNLPGRMILGGHCYYENLPRLLPELLRRATPEDIGQGMKRLCSRPNYVNLNSLALGYLNGREQARLLGKAPVDDPDQVADVLEFWARVARSYRNDGVCLPDEADFTIPILPAETVQQLQGRLRSDLPAGLRQQIRRMIATLELYTFILHGEARVGVFHHGPYPLEGGEFLVVKELVGLQEDFYPWARLETRLPYNHIARVMRIRNARTKMVLFGSLVTEPKDYQQCITAQELFVVEGGECRPLPAEQLPRLTAIAADAQLELYRRVIDWDDRYRVEYGAELYGCLLKTFAEPLGFAEEFGRSVRACFRESIQRHVDDLQSGREPPLVLQHIAKTKGPIYSPLQTT